MKLQDKGKITGSFVIRTYKAGTKILLRESPRIYNKIVSGAGGYGRNLVLRQLSGDMTYPLEIDSGAIGTGSTAPADSDTGLAVTTLTGIIVTSADISGNDLVVGFFIPDLDLANGTYTEFGAFCNGRLFARALISPSHVKSSGEDTAVEYTFTFS